MARSARSTPLETRTGRFRLPEGKRHAVTIGKGLILVYPSTLTKMDPGVLTES